MPRPVVFDGRQLPASYANFYIAHAEIYFVHGGPILDHCHCLPLCLAWIRCRGGGFSDAGLGTPRIRGLAATCFDCAGFGACHLEASPKHRPSCRRHRIEVRSKIRNGCRNGNVRSEPQMSRIAIIEMCIRDSERRDHHPGRYSRGTDWPSDEG